MVDPLEVICSVVAGEIFQKIVSPIIGNYNSQKHLEEKLQQLRQLLITIHAVLEAAEGQSITNSWLLRWIRKLEDAACEGGRVLRDWRNSTNEVSYGLLGSSNTFKRIKVATAQFLSCNEATVRIDDTVRKVEIVAAGTDKLIELLRFECSQAVVHRPIIISVSMHDRVVGRIKERQHTIDFLLRPPVDQIYSTYIRKFDHRGRTVSMIPYGYVLPIWGRKGVGKTTLAQLITIYEQLASRMGNHNVLSVGFLPMEDLGCLKGMQSFGCKSCEWTTPRQSQGEVLVQCLE